MEGPHDYIAPRKVKRWQELVHCLTRELGGKPGLPIAEARAFAARRLAPRRLILDGEMVVGRVNSLKAWEID